MDAGRVSGAIHTVGDLVARGLADERDAAALAALTARYALAITPAMAALIDPSDPHDPIARQFVPDLREADALPEELADPIGDAAHSPVEGVVHRYPDRVLLKLLHICPVYCRFCFRREMVGPGAEQVLSPAKVAAALDYIRSDPAIWEVILTGGDPLALSARRLREVMQALGEIEHVKILRLHTRVPAVDPARVTPELVDALRVPGKTTWVALHANHPRELGDAAAAALARLADAGLALVSQSVLLAGVNDDLATLSALMRRFVELRVKPYYLHHGDLAPGTSHLRVDLETGRALVSELRAGVSGLCQPAYVLDIPGGHGKVPVGPDHLRPGGVVDHRGQTHAYPAVARKPDCSR
ncbi:MAG: lysine 2,3-aminomutase YodO family protein [Hyphomicrobiales bacterium]|nr:lysine 2,3-aminomutase YodO family protein [Hyphomicrobiales bacterium]